MAEAKNLTLVVFASDQGPGDATRASIMSQTGNLLAKRGAKIICMAEKGDIPLPLLTSACAAGGQVELICDAECELPDGLKNLTTQEIPDRTERLKLLAQSADCFIGLPGSLATSTSHFLTIAELGANTPMVFLNQNNAYEILRGFSADVFVHSFQKAHRNVQFAETVEDIWVKVAKLLNI